MNSAGRFASGLLSGAAFAGVMFFWPNSDPDAPATSMPAMTATTSTTALAPCLGPGEGDCGATVLLPRGLEVEDGVARFDYELTGLGLTLGVGQDAGTSGDVLTFPEIWVLTTRAGATIEATTGPTAAAARFELPSDDTAVAQIEVVGWRRATAFGERVELPIEVGAAATFRAGEAIIETVLDQRNSTIVQIDFDSNSGEWHNGLLRPVQSGWRVSGRSGGGVQLLWDGSDAPSSVVLEDVSLEMRPVAESVIVHTAEGQP